MNAEKLKELRICEKKAVRFTKIFGVPLLLTVLAMLVHMLITGPELKAVHVGIYMLFVIVWLVITSHFGFKEMKYVNQEEFGIISILEQFLQSEGISEDSFEIVWNELTHEYMVAFHNQTINYDDLDQKVQTLIYELNKIVNKNVKVKLL